MDILAALLIGLLLSRVASFLTRRFFNHSVDEWHESTIEMIKQKDLVDKNDFNTKKFPLLKHGLTIKGFSAKNKFHQYLSDIFCCVFLALGVYLFKDKFELVQALLFTIIILLLGSHILTDFHEHLLMDEVSYTLIWLGLLSHLSLNYSIVPTVSVGTAVLGAFVGYMSFYLFGKLFKILRGIDGLGMGDAKLMAAFGAWIGLFPLVWIALLGACLAMVGVFAFKTYHFVTKDKSIPIETIDDEENHQEFPFGPALCLSFIIVMFLLLTNHLPSLV